LSNHAAGERRRFEPHAIEVKAMTALDAGIEPSQSKEIT
jgi:hypothetical protein